MPNAIVADLSHHYWDDDHEPDFAAAKEAGLVGVIFKASQGATFRDKTYEKTRKLATDAGLLWGAYHFATKADAKNQVANFLNSASLEGGDLVAIDFERNEPSPANSTTANVTLDILRRCEDKLGRKPVLYTGSYMFDLFGHNPSAELAAYRVWWAQYASIAHVHPTWTDYWLWQFTDGKHGPEPRNAVGVGHADFSHFDGSSAELKAQWAS